MKKKVFTTPISAQASLVDSVVSHYDYRVADPFGGNERAFATFNHRDALGDIYSVKPYELSAQQITDAIADGWSETWLLENVCTVAGTVTDA